MLRLLPFLIFPGFVACDEIVDETRAPVIEAARPEAARPGQRVTLVGRNFGLRGERDLVVLGGREVEVDGWADRVLEVRVPPEAEPGVFDFVIRTAEQVSRPLPFEVLPPLEE